MSDLVSTFRSYALDKDNCPRMDTEVVYVRVGLLLEAADRIEQLEAALRFYAGWPQGPAGNIAPLLIDAGYKARAALGEDRT